MRNINNRKNIVVRRKDIHIIIIFLLVILINNFSFAYDDKIAHPKITNKAAQPENSQLDYNLKNNLGFEYGIQTIFTSSSKTENILELLEKGSTDEDTPACRASNHFHDPLKPWNDSYMSDDVIGAAWLIRQKCNIDGWTYSNRYSNVTWATGYLSPAPYGPKASFTTNPDYAPINWDKAREYYYNALTNTTNLQPPFPPGRDYYFAKTFQSLGHVLHLLEDMAVPAHVRNDFTSHVVFNGITSPDFLRWFGNHYEYYVQNHSEIISSQTIQYPSFTNTRLTDFWDTDQFNSPYSGLDIGLAEFTNLNYLSDSTIPYTLRMPYHWYTYPKIDDLSKIQICMDYEPGSTDTRVYLSRRDRGDCPTITTARLADHFAALGFWNDFSVNTIIDAILNLDPTMLATPVSLDDNVHNTYAEDLLPRAVGYSAGLLDYFFRGTLEITPPDSYVYSITDGSVIPQKFIHIKAKIRNTTPDEVVHDCDIQQSNCILQAVAKYKIIPNYMPDLSTYPPDETTMHNTPYSYSVSAPIEITSLSSDTPTEFTFDFSQSTIPAGITDLYLQVVFKGTLGNETDIAVAVGMKDLMEPTHQVFWNLSDMFSLYIQQDTAYHLYLSDYNAAYPEILCIRYDLYPDMCDEGLFDLVDLNLNGVPNEQDEPYVDPFPITFGIGYLSGPPQQGQTVYYSAISPAQPGEHIRLIALMDKPQDNYLVLKASDAVSGISYYYFTSPGVVNQEVDGVWQTPTPLTTFRYGLAIDGITHIPIRQHFYTGVLGCYPVIDPDGTRVCPYPEAESIPAELTPITLPEGGLMQQQSPAYSQSPSYSQSQAASPSGATGVVIVE